MVGAGYAVEQMGGASGGWSRWGIEREEDVAGWGWSTRAMAQIGDEAGGEWSRRQFVRQHYVWVYFPLVVDAGEESRADGRLSGRVVARQPARATRHNQPNSQQALVTKPPASTALTSRVLLAGVFTTSPT